MAKSTRSTQQLWLDAHKSVYYLIPGDEQLPTGTFLLQTPAGETTHVDETAVSPYQITREQAAAFIEAQFRDGLTQTKTALSGLLALDQDPQPEPTTPISTPEVNPVSSVDSHALAHDLLGFTPADLEQDPEQVKEKVDALFQGIKSFLQNVTSGDAADLDAARSQIQSLRGTLTRHGITTNDTMETLPDQINALFHDKPQNREEQFAADLQKLADRIRETAVSLAPPDQTESDS